MFISDRLIYLQLYKTGCTHIEKLLHKLVPREYHQKHGRIPENFNVGDRKIIGSIRDPWDWYISLWGFGCDGKGILCERLTHRDFRGNGLIGAVPNVNLQQKVIVFLSQLKKSVKDWQEVYSSSSDPELFRRWLKMLFDPANKYLLGDGFGLSPISSYAGLLTYYYVQLFSQSYAGVYSSKVNHFKSLLEFDQANNLLDAVIRMESLEEDFICILREIGYEISQEQEQEIRSLGKTNSSSRKPSVTYYYDQESIDLIAEREQLIIQKYGYQIPNLIQHLQKDEQASICN